MSRIPQQDESSPGQTSGRPYRLESIETYRKIPIYHLIYEGSVVLDQKTHEEEIRIIASIPPEKFGLVICFQNLSISSTRPCFPSALSTDV